MGISVAHQQRGSSPTCFQVELEFRNVAFVEGEKNPYIWRQLRESSLQLQSLFLETLD